MNIIEKFGRWFGTKSFLRRESSMWAQRYFSGPREDVARAVGYSLVQMLGVNFTQLTPGTNIVAELAANEWTEWVEIQQCIEEELSCYFAAQPGFSGRTITELVDFVVASKLPCPSKKPKRDILSSTDWCLAGCLR